MIKITIANIFKQLGLTLTTIVSLTITLFIISFMWMSYLNLNYLSNEIDQSFKVVVNINPDLSKDKNVKEYEQIESSILKIPNVENFKFSSKDEELNIIKSTKMGEQLSENLEGENPLSDTYYVSVKDEKYLKNVALEIKKIKNVESANYGGGDIYNLIKQLHASENILIIIIATLIIIAILLMSNILRVAILHQKEAIEIMRLVGASNSYIRLPYILEGLIVTVISFIFSSILFYFTQKVIYSGFEKLSIGNIKLDNFNMVYLTSIAISFGVGLLISLFASTITIRRFIKI